MARYLLDKEGNLTRIFRVLVVNGAKVGYVVTLLCALTHKADSFLRELLIRLNIAENSSRVTVAREGFNLKSRVNQRIASCKGITLCACKNVILAD